jgi:hypothetical protein
MFILRSLQAGTRSRARLRQRLGWHQSARPDHFCQHGCDRLQKSRLERKTIALKRGRNRVPERADQAACGNRGPQRRIAMPLGENALRRRKEWSISCPREAWPTYNDHAHGPETGSASTPRR